MVFGYATSPAIPSPDFHVPASLRLARNIQRCGRHPAGHIAWLKYAENGRLLNFFSLFGPKISLDFSASHFNCESTVSRPSLTKIIAILFHLFFIGFTFSSLPSFEKDFESILNKFISSLATDSHQYNVRRQFHLRFFHHGGAPIQCNFEF